MSVGIRSLDLFTGYGGFALAGLLLGWEPVCYVEYDEQALARLIERIELGLLPDAPIWDDVRTFPAHRFRGEVDVVCGGFPCQPFSVAGKGLAANDERNCWPETFDIIRCVRPRWAFLENVPGLLTGSHGYFGEILRGLADAGYNASWGVLSGADVGAPHKRERLWILASDANGLELRNESEWPTKRRHDLQREGQAIARNDGAQGPPPDMHNLGCSIERVRGVFDGQRAAFGDNADGRSYPNPWARGTSPQPTIPRVDDGLADRLDFGDQWVARTRGTGNGLIPLVAATAWDLLVEGNE